VAVVNVEYTGNVLNRDPAFGFLIPSSQKEPILGVIFDSSAFPQVWTKNTFFQKRFHNLFEIQGDRTIFTAMMGGRWFNKNFGDNPTVEQVEKIAQEQV